MRRGEGAGPLSADYVSPLIWGATSRVIDMVWLYRSLLPVERKGVFFLF
jgi:hypothetical protein